MIEKLKNDIEGVLFGNLQMQPVDWFVETCCELHNYNFFYRKIVALQIALRNKTISF